jgi:NAD(P)-dependent dehydrogenase (short-subunit alcohol dehydrogenase family)
MPQGWLEGKVAVVTGSGRGIGRGVAMLMAAEGAKVVVNDPGVAVDGTGHDNGPAAEVVAEIKAKGGTAVPNFDTVATLEGGENIIKTALDNFGRIDILVNVAGILRDRMIFNMPKEDWDAVIAVHLKGHFNTIKPASILMRQQRWGRIINFSSTSGLTGNAGQANYGAAKAGIAGLTRVVARDLGRYGVTCNAIAPGAATRMTATVPQAARDLRARAGIQGAGAAPAGGGGGAAAPCGRAAGRAPAPGRGARDATAFHDVAGAGVRGPHGVLPGHGLCLEYQRPGVRRLRRPGLSEPPPHRPADDLQAGDVDAGRAGPDGAGPRAGRGEPGAARR